MKLALKLTIRNRIKHPYPLCQIVQFSFRPHNDKNYRFKIIAHAYIQRHFISMWIKSDATFVYILGFISIQLTESNVFKKNKCTRTSYAYINHILDGTYQIWFIIDHTVPKKTVWHTHRNRLRLFYCANCQHKHIFANACMRVRSQTKNRNWSNYEAPFFFSIVNEYNERRLAKIASLFFGKSMK